MSFLLRAALAIGALSYFAMLRGQPEVHGGADASIRTAAVVEAAETGFAAQSPHQSYAPPASPPPGASASLGGLAAIWSAMPADARQRIVRDGVAELGRRAATMTAASRDTLAESDRKSPWRGVDPR